MTYTRSTPQNVASARANTKTCNCRNTGRPGRLLQNLLVPPSRPQATYRASATGNRNSAVPTPVNSATVPGNNMSAPDNTPPTNTAQTPANSAPISTRPVPQENREAYTVTVAIPFKKALVLKDAALIEASNRLERLDDSQEGPVTKADLEELIRNGTEILRTKETVEPIKALGGFGSWHAITKHSITLSEVFPDGSQHLILRSYIQKEDQSSPVLKSPGGMSEIYNTMLAEIVDELNNKPDILRPGNASITKYPNSRSAVITVPFNRPLIPEDAVLIDISGDLKELATKDQIEDLIRGDSQKISCTKVTPQRGLFRTHYVRTQHDVTMKNKSTLAVSGRVPKQNGLILQMAEGRIYSVMTDRMAGSLIKDNAPTSHPGRMQQPRLFANAGRLFR